MADYIVNENGVERQATDVEKAEIDARNKAWTDDAPNRKLKQVKEIRLQKLIETDYLALGDVTLPANIETWRQTLRDIPANHTNEAAYDLLLARTDGELTHEIWTKP